MLLSRAFVRSETQTASLRIWTLTDDPISFDDNRYTMHALSTYKSNFSSDTSASIQLVSVSKFFNVTFYQQIYYFFSTSKSNFISDIPFSLIFY